MAASSGAASSFEFRERHWGYSSPLYFRRKCELSTKRQWISGLKLNR